MTCRERAGQVRDRYDDLRATGAGVTAIGTGGRRYAQAFIEDESVPFPVLLDDDGVAADIVEMNTLDLASVLRPDALFKGARTLARGNRQHKTGRRPTQLGATLVLGPGNELLYLDKEAFAGDHADLDDVLAALAPD
ncbi:MAG: peroxiredoxin-like family protein [Acidimicrobiia bacterium]